MGLKKAKLISNVKGLLQGLGYTEFKDADFAMFIKNTGDGMFLSLLLTISNLYYDEFHASYFYNLHTVGNYFGGGEFLDCGRPLHWLMSKEEVRSHTPEGKDPCCWSGMDTAELPLFIDAVKLTEPRMIAKKDYLMSKLQNSSFVTDIVQLHKEVQEEVCNPSIEFLAPYLYNVKRYTSAPKEWYEGAERVIVKNGLKHSISYIKFIAEPSYREFILENQYGMSTAQTNSD